MSILDHPVSPRALTPPYVTETRVRLDEDGDPYVEVTDTGALPEDGGHVLTRVSAFVHEDNHGPVFTFAGDAPDDMQPDAFRRFISACRVLADHVEDSLRVPTLPAAPRDHIDVLWGGPVRVEADDFEQDVVDAAGQAREVLPELTDTDLSILAHVSNGDASPSGATRGDFVSLAGLVVVGTAHVAVTALGAAVLRAYDAEQDAEYEDVA